MVLIMTCYLVLVLTIVATVRTAADITVIYQWGATLLATLLVQYNHN